MKSSFSQNSVYKKCPQHWSWKYQHRLVSPIEGASLYFGSAVDEAVMGMLEGKTDAVEKFKSRWKNAFQWGKTTPVFDNVNITYGYADYDEYVFQPGDEAVLLGWAQNLGLSSLGTTSTEIYKEIVKIKKNPYKTITADQLKYFSRASWLSLERKGEVLIEAFRTQFLPKVTKVHATQQQGSIKDPNSGDMIQGYIDMVLEIEGYDKPIVFDLKTAANPYKSEQIDHSDQLTLYAAMKGQEYNTDLVGYVVLCKNIPKDSTGVCTSCGYTKNSSHRSCNNEIAGKRCNGAWNEQKDLAPEVQVLVRQKSAAEIHSCLSDFENIMFAMKKNVVFKNTDNCTNWYGGMCPYYSACYKGDTSGLKEK